MTSRPETDAISAGLGWVCALDKEFTGAERAPPDQGGGPERRLAAFVMDERAIPRQGMRIEPRRRGDVRHALAHARPGHRPRLRAGRVGEPGESSWSTCAGGRGAPHVVKKPIYKRGGD